MNKSFITFASIMFFYAILACFLGPVLFYFLWKKSFKIAGYGFITGSIVSIMLWLFYGQKMI